MKSYHLILAALSAAVLSSCVEPVVVGGGPPAHYRSPYGSPGYSHSSHSSHSDRYSRTRDYRDNDHRDRDHRDYRDPRNPRSPYSPGGSVVLPGEARRVNYHGQTYYNHHNTWYRRAGAGYVIVARPY